MVKLVLSRIIFLPLVTICSMCAGIGINALFFGGLVSTLSTREAIILVNVSPPFMVWIGIIGLISSSTYITKIYTLESYTQGKRTITINGTLIWRVVLASFWVGMIIYYQFFAPNLP